MNLLVFTVHNLRTSECNNDLFIKLLGVGYVDCLHYNIAWQPWRYPLKPCINVSTVYTNTIGLISLYTSYCGVCISLITEGNYK